MRDKILEKYNFEISSKSKKEIEKWFNSLNQTQKNNFLSLNINPEDIKFDKNILINNDLLNKDDYLKRVNAIISIDNADGWYHLFDRLVTKEFLDSPKFYQDIETLKRAESAQTPLWIIGDKTFIDSPYHDIDFEKLVTAKDSSRDCDWVVSENIATIAKNKDSINSIHHEEDLEAIIKYGSKSLQTPSSYPKASMGYLAVDPVSLNDKYHRENMEILAHNYEYDIGGYLYQIMTNENAIHHRDYRNVIYDIIDNKDNANICFLLCTYLVGLDNAENGRNFLIGEDPRYLIMKLETPLDELLKKVEERYNVIDVNFQEETIEIEDKQTPIDKETPKKSSIKERIRSKFKKKL